MRMNTIGAATIHGLQVIDETPDNSDSNSQSASGEPEDPESKN
jgi:hypothetical protein